MGAKMTESSTSTRDRIANGALQLFSEKGFAGTAVREIAGAVDLTVPAIYYHFKSKDGLLAALVETFVADGDQLLEKLSSATPAQRRKLALPGYYDVLVQNLAVFRFVMADPSVRSHEQAGRLLAEQATRYLHLLVGDKPTHIDLIRANAALGALRRPLRLREVDVVADRAQILSSSQAALVAKA